MPIPPSNPEQPPTGLYLHVPFCVKRCLYCDFYVLPLGDGPPSKRLREFRNLKHHRFLQALDHELASLPSDFQPRTVYIGGGTSISPRSHECVTPLHGIAFSRPHLFSAKGIESKKTFQLSGKEHAVCAIQVAESFFL